MPYDRVERLVRELEVGGLVEVSHEGSSKRVSITGKGLKSLEDLERAIRVLEKLGLD